MNYFPYHPQNCEKIGFVNLRPERTSGFPRLENALVEVKGYMAR